MKYLTGAVEILAGLVAGAFVLGLLLGLGARLTLGFAAWVGRLAQATKGQRERVPGAAVGLSGRLVEYRPDLARASTTWRN